MSESDLEIQDGCGWTALYYAAAGGITQIAKSLIQKNKKLVQIPTLIGRIPVVESSVRGHKDITRYLYFCTPFELFYPENGWHGSSLLSSTITNQIFDIALDLLRRCPCLTLALDDANGTPLQKLARQPSAFPSSVGNLGFWKRWIYSCATVKLLVGSSDILIDVCHVGKKEQSNISAQGQCCGVVFRILQFLGMKQMYDLKLNHAYGREITDRMCAEISMAGYGEHMSAIEHALFQAVSNGLVEIVIGMIKANPDLMDHCDHNGRNIIMSSVVLRQEKIFNLIFGFDARRYRLVGSPDKHINNILHLAGILAPSAQLTRISGAALQMQRELQWFKEVESIVPPHFRQYVNTIMETPWQMFTKEHKQLRIEGEKWMKATATSSTVVGALIITIMFTALFTVPGGNIQDTGLPVFLPKKAFKVFIIFDAISLFASSTSVLMFLGILTSRYREEDFLESLPTKLIIGLSTLFLSLASMMVTFCAALIIILNGILQLVIPMILVTSVPVTLFMILQFPLLVEIFISTYGAGIFDRKLNPW